jgi:integrase/recombinase XerD
MNRQILTDSELTEALLTTTNHTKWGYRNRLLLMMTHMTGIRRSELAALRIGDILGIGGDIRADVPLNTGRMLFLPKRLQQELKIYIAAYFETSALAGMAYAFGHLPLFYTQKLNPFTPTALSQTFRQIYERAGILGASTRTGRQTWLHTLRAKGLDRKVLGKLAGQKRLTAAPVELTPSLLRAGAEMI